MATTTGIELGPDTCVLAGVRTTRGAGADIVALHTIEAAAWPAHDAALAETLRSVRRSKKFPKRARVVAWGLPEDAGSETVSRAAIRPLLEAGFHVERVVTPPQALAILAGTRRRPGVHNAGVVWLALNMHGAAIAIVRGNELLFARTFQWAYNPHVLEGKAQLLQRYSLIAHLAPEVRRGIAAVRASHDIPVDAAVTCGDLPELRSLTMPLIEELDLEVETLDGMDGLRPVGSARFERLAEAAPAIRLACAAALGSEQRRRSAATAIAGVAAAAALVAAIAYGTYAYFTRATLPHATVHAGEPAPPPRAGTTSSAALPTSTTPAPPRGTPPVLAKLTPPPPAVDAKPPSQAAAAPQTKRPGLSGQPPAKTIPMREGPSPRADLSPVPQQQIRRSTDMRRESRPVPLADPLPKVDSILIDQERRLAIVDGAVVNVGDQVGSRVIAEIQRDGIVLREPSGLLIRVPVRSRQVSLKGVSRSPAADYISVIRDVANGRDPA